jgi:hypothetical protein
MVGEAIVASAVVGLRILAAAGSSLAAAMRSAGVLILLAGVGAATGELDTVAWCLVGAGVIESGLWWHQLWRQTDTVAAVQLDGAHP